MAKLFKMAIGFWKQSIFNALQSPFFPNHLA
jgi:hypothetical protein